MKKIESRMQILKGLTLQRMWVQGRSSKSLGDSALSEQDLAELAITMADFDAAIKRTTRFLEVDSIPFLQQAHVMEIVNQRKVPAIGRVDLVVSGHLHPLLKIRQDRYSLHWCDSIP